VICLSSTSTIAAAIKAGMSVAEARKRFAPNDRAEQLLRLCERLGAAPAENLERLAEVEAAQAKAVSELEVAASGPRASARLVTILPLVVLLGAQLLGMKVLNQLNPLCIASIAIGALLLYGGRQWSYRILKRAQPVEVDPGAPLDAFSAAMGSGLPLNQAISEVVELFGEQPSLKSIAEAAAETGLAVARLARVEADKLRLAWRVESEKKVHEAGVRLMWPLGLAVLPAFVLIAVVPLAASMLRGN
jgi:tight adherence protein B